ncbi:hypothetical protein FCU94_13210 [Vibrio sp. JPW-9-11-11]|uniref:hypothetical protein n=1 Tax=Vibrio sp. JPW-9-11-11 TaxID=1416532 RepID=UPI001593E0C9|nr:hypothetical protein [Vibrio sp. JPW-9-11-11]NVD07843.1 hypothetical protein [Vibrio sp. JPW-9-11-11]
MDTPKIFLATLAVACVVLVTLLWLKTDHGQQFNGRVLSQTVTQSLDGHRRYLKVTSPQGELMLQVAATIDCPAGSEVAIEQRQSLFSKVNSFHLIRCLKN